MRAGRAVLAVFAAVALLSAVAGPAEAHRLTYSKAKAAAQNKGDQVAGKRTRVNTLIRQSRHRYYAQAKWTQVIPDGCKGCVYNPTTGQVEDGPTTEYCFVELSVRFRSRTSYRVVARLVSKVCH